MRANAPAPKGLKKAGFQAAEGEVCYGCGQTIQPAPTLPPEYPPLPPTSVVGVMHEEDVDAGWTTIEHPTGEAGEDGQKYVAVPVCIPCHVDPAHRTAHQLKCHFFERRGNASKIGLMLAGSMGIQG
jgi:hypothetical protein